jgi:hypothetical protein
MAGQFVARFLVPIPSLYSSGFRYRHFEIEEHQNRGDCTSVASLLSLQAHAHETDLMLIARRFPDEERLVGAPCRVARAAQSLSNTVKCFLRQCARAPPLQFFIWNPLENYAHL